MAVLIFDARTGELRSANRGVRKAFGDFDLTPDSMKEQFGTATFRRADGRVISEQGTSLERVLVSGESVRDEEMIIELSDGRTFVANVNATPVLSPDGSVDSVIVAAQDIAPLAEIERLRAEFLGMVSHELRSPLAAIKGSSSTLLAGQATLDPAEMLQYHRIIDEQADYMRDLINNLTDIVRIEAGMLAVKPVPLALAPLVDEARNVFLNAGGRDNIRIELPPDLPLVVADRRRIVQVINNLLANAARHSNEKSTIRLGARVQDVHVAVFVVDSGRGISAERMPQLFTKFVSSDDPDQARNLGLGLAICKGIIEAHGGRIWAESDGLGLGSQFTFTIPTSDETTPWNDPPRVKASPRERQPISSDLTRVLAVDDDPGTLKHVRDSLANAGYEPVVTGDPDEVLSLIRETDPQVVLLDLMLPGEDGIEVMKNILAVHDLPVIFLSGYDQDELIAKAFEMGAVDYMVKPFSPTELAARVRAALRKKPEGSETVELGDLAINFTERSVAVGRQFVELTPLEFRLLAKLASNAGAAISHTQLLQEVWESDQEKDVQSMRTVVKNLRQKLGDDARNPRYVVTVPRVGYRMPKPM